MNCSEANLSCHPYLDEQLDPAKRDAVAAHLQSCQTCAGHFASQRQFLSLMKRCVEPRGQYCASAGFKARALQSLDAVSKVVKLPPLRMRTPLATAACAMLMLTGMIGWQSTCTSKQCPLVRAAQHEHDNIIAGNRPILASAAEPKVLSSMLCQFMKDFPGVPNLTKCSLKPSSCGKVKLAALPEGVFVSYDACGCTAEPVTLMAFQTDATPGGKVVTFNNQKFLAATHARHRVLAWHAEKNGMLYILVTKRDLHDSLVLAEAARSPSQDARRNLSNSKAVAANE